MTKRLLRRARADRDIEEAIEHYLEEGAGTAALRLVDPLEAAFELIARFPGSGSPRYAIELDIADLRSLPLQNYPYLVFYIEHDDVIDIVRLLHSNRDMPSSLS